MEFNNSNRGFGMSGGIEEEYEGWEKDEEVSEEVETEESQERTTGKDMISEWLSKNTAEQLPDSKKESDRQTIKMKGKPPSPHEKHFKEVGRERKDAETRSKGE